MTSHPPVAPGEARVRSYYAQYAQTSWMVGRKWWEDLPRYLFDKALSAGKGNEHGS